MRLFEMKGMSGGKLPAKAGEARLEWGGSGSHPHRRGDTIYLPTTDDVQFFPLKKGRQFLIETPSRRDNVLHFGGTDEQPFLVQLSLHVLPTIESGEESFYAALRPKLVGALESRFGTQVIRQGDWFGVPFPNKFNWDDLVGLFLLGHEEVERKDTDKKGYALDKTRHRLFDGCYIASRYASHQFIGEGTLRAPDHEDKEFKGPHAFFQTAHLVDPANAD